MARGAESRFTSDYLMPSLYAAGCWAYKIPDPQIIPGHKVATSERPFDIVVCTNSGSFVAIEVKWLDRYEAFGCHTKAPFSEHQKKNLTNVKKVGGDSLVMLGVQAYGEKRLHVWNYSDLFAVGRNLTKMEMLKCPYLSLTTITTNAGVKKRVYDLTDWV